MKIHSIAWIGLLALTVLLFAGIGLSADADVPRMTVHELQAHRKDPAVVILDVRHGQDWQSSELKIAGAVRADPAAYSAWSDAYPHTGRIVLYCA